MQKIFIGGFLLMIASVFFLILGFLLLVKGADLFVDGASSIAKRLRIPSLIIGLTIVAFGTSAPELAVSVTAALKGSNDIALGNVVGSNIFNLLVVIGVSAMICPLAVEKSMIKKDYPLSIGATLLLGLLVMDQFLGKKDAMSLSRLDGIILLAGFALFMYLTIREGLAKRKEQLQSQEEEIPVKYSLPVSILLSVAGLLGIIFGGDMTVNSAKEIARAFGLSEALIGLTIVAIGTSLPELVTSVVASKKGESDIALGNAVGSNLFNILFILGVSSTILPMSVSPTYLYDIGFLLVVSLLVFIPVAAKQKISRGTGAAMTGAYILYTIYLIMR